MAGPPGPVLDRETRSGGSSCHRRVTLVAFRVIGSRILIGTEPVRQAEVVLLWDPASLSLEANEPTLGHLTGTTLSV